jgi:hypothetical protein
MGISYEQKQIKPNHGFHRRVTSIMAKMKTVRDNATERYQIINRMQPKKSFQQEVL